MRLLNNKYQFIIGYLCLAGWSLTSTISRVYLSNFEQKINPVVLCVYIFLITNIFFVFVNYNNLEVIWKKIVIYKNDVIRYNISTFCTWFFATCSLEFLEPSLSQVINLSLGTIFTLILLKYFYKTRNININDFYVCIGFFIAVIYSIIIILLNKSSLKLVSYNHTVISIFFCYYWFIFFFYY